jgi:hypothetical protein
MAEHELWSFNNALFFIILIIIIVFASIFGINKVFDVKKIKNNWAEERCNPSIMPFASLFGHNTKENFEFCMGKIFSTHSMPMFGSVTGIFSHFTGLLQMVFDSISSLRNVIASLGGGINVVFQEFTERISMFFFKLRVSAITIKMLIGRMYAIMFSVMYMGLSGITGMTSFTNTALFSFMDTFCFPSNTLIDIRDKGKIAIKDVKIGDIIMPSESKVTATFRFFSRGQPMVRLGNTIVSTNHYVKLLGHPVKAGEHPDAIHIGPWESDEPLYCLDTHDHIILVDGHEFLDYDETSDGDHATMHYIQSRINAKNSNAEYTFQEYCPAMTETTAIKTQRGNILAKDIKIGDKLTTGSEVTGLIRRKVSEVCTLDDNTVLTPSTLYWEPCYNKWIRIGEKLSIIKKEMELISFIVVPNSQIELSSGLRIRDYMELCSPDSEIHYSKCLEGKQLESKLRAIVI